ncbi:MAG: DnaJ domain-containing protein [Acidobacteria bacterium]|nr:DnaJ domain-containing protein [Acidobacteriota bacterium]
MEERRRKPRNATPVSGDITIGMERSNGELQTRRVRLVDVSEWGLGFNTDKPMVVGAKLYVWGSALPHAPDEARRTQMQVVHCRLLSEEGLYRAGCAYEGAPRSRGDAAVPKAESSLVDLYEVLQVSPSADNETIHRVYRFLAQRYHPDNPDTGDQTAFQAVLQAYQVLSDPERRAAYDLSYQGAKTLRWKIFEKPSGAEGIEAERRMRSGILSALYAKKRTDPEGQGMMLREIEDLLGCPREHLQFPFWYLRRKGLIEGPQNGRYEITLDGVDAAEAYESEGYGPKAATIPQIEAPKGRG